MRFLQSQHTRPNPWNRSPNPNTGPPYVLASFIPGKTENIALDVTFTDDVRISVSVISSPPLAAAAATPSKGFSQGPSASTKGSKSKAAKIAEAPPQPRYIVHLTGNIDDSYEVEDGDGGGDRSEGEKGESDEDESGSDTVGADTWIASVAVRVVYTRPPLARMRFQPPPGHPKPYTLHSDSHDVNPIT